MSGTTTGASGTTVGRGGIDAWPSDTTAGTAHIAYHEHREKEQRGGPLSGTRGGGSRGTTAPTAAPTTAEPDTRKPRLESRQYQRGTGAVLPLMAMGGTTAVGQRYYRLWR